MKSNTALAATLFALTSLPLLAQQSYPANQSSSPASQQTPAGAGAASQPSPAASTETSAAEMSPVSSELMSKLDSKTATAGDNVVLRTKTSVKTASGTEIPKGSKLVGHVIGVQASAAGANSQMALQFDHVELKSGQNLPVHSQIQSITPAGVRHRAAQGPRVCLHRAPPARALLTRARVAPLRRAQMQARLLLLETAALRQGPS